MRGDESMDPEQNPDAPAAGEPPADPDYTPLTEAQVRDFVSTIPAHAEKFRELAKKLNGVDLDYSAASIPRLDDLIAENWPDGPPAHLDNMVLSYGSYLGETIRTLHGGDWCHSEEMAFHLDIDGMKVFPFGKVRRRFVNGKEDSLGFFYQVIWTELSRRQNPFAELPVEPTPPPIILAPAPAAATPPPPIPPAPPSPPPIPRLTPIMPPLPSIPAKKKPARNWAVIVILFVVVAVAGFVGYRVVQFVHYVRTHPSSAQPGEVEFREANGEIIAGKAGEVFGNSDEARQLAAEYSKSFKILRDNFFTKGGGTVLGGLEGDFLTYCQLNDDSCVFLVHVPELRKFTGDAKKSLTDLAWMNAQSVLQAATNSPPKTVVVGVKGLLLYDAIMIGDYVADAQPGKDGIRTRGSGLKDMEMFYPFFAPSMGPDPDEMTNAPSATAAAADAGAGADITIQSAKFGTGGKQADVMAKVTELLHAHPEGFKISYKTLAADPAPGKKKQLTISYEYKGTNHVLTVPNGKQLSKQALVKNALK